MQRGKDGLTGAQRVLVGHRVTADEVLQAANGFSGRSGAGDDASQANRENPGQRPCHAVSGLADGDDADLLELGEIEFIGGYGKGAVGEAEILGKGAGDAALDQRVIEDGASGGAHSRGELGVGLCLGGGHDVPNNSCSQLSMVMRISLRCPAKKWSPGMNTSSFGSARRRRPLQELGCGPN